MSETQHFSAADGTRIAWRAMGEGRAVLLLHGFCSDAQTNWIKYGATKTMVEAGFRCIMPDHRAHGESEKPHDPAFYPPDILADDAMALADALGLTDYDLVGYSLGARTAARMLAKGASPRRAILSGMGLEGVSSTDHRRDHFRHILADIDGHPKGSAAWMAATFIKQSGGDPVALDRILDTFVDTPEAVLAGFTLHIGVVCGVDDQDNGSAQKLADVLPNAELITIPGNHMSAVTRPEFGAALASFLTA
ncbi:MAG TPA: alpha/beta hydrolase [Chakrabartia sp.]|jgi:pimeloyl-ACP methyl ester carboxylesterase|nr:alpha/beta hydrolase [Chakrabartia sp.]